MSRFVSLRTKLEKTVRFNRAGWIVLHEWKTCPIVGEYMDTLRFDDKDLALDYYIKGKGKYTLDSECKVA
jgi:hypothetical protein